MAVKTDGGTKGYTFLWKIENRSRCWWMKKEQVIESPKFVPDALEGTNWSLWLYPKGSTDENYVAFFLNRKFMGRQNVYEVNFQLAFLGKDGSILKERTVLKHGFRRGENWGFSHYEERAKVFVEERESFLPENTLTVQCMIWEEEEKPIETKLVSARTVFKENRRSFAWRIHKFSILKSDLKKKFKDGFMDFDLVLNEELDNEKGLVVNINSIDESIKYFSLKTFVVDFEGKNEVCGHHETFINELEKGEFSTQIFCKNFMENKTRYLPNDILSLNCDCVIWTQTVSYERFRSGNKNSVERHKSRNVSVLVQDLKSMYTSAILCDAELRTTTRTFPAHKTILCARSPVFRRMFSNDMKEKHSGQVDITDFEDDTVHRMLLYMYAEALENLQFESALKLYTIADKYEILSLKSKCSSFLKDNLCPTNACDVLDLADLHQDDDLKSVVLDYILRQDKEFFRSQKWKNFMKVHNELAQDVMYEKLCQE